MKIKAIKDTVLASEIEHGAKILASGIILPDDDGKEHGIHPRWCKIYDIGPMANVDVEVGDYVLVEHGRWSRAATIITEDGEKLEVRKIDTDAMLLTSKELPQGIQWNVTL